MVQMFYGPWHLTYTKSDPDRRNRLVIYGTDGMDGTYERPFPGDDIVLEVTGAVWSADIESSPRDEESWESCLRKAVTSYDPDDGITVILFGHAALEEGWMENVVRCVYKDPELNPPPVPDPFDFTYGEG